jgi:RNA-binding protein
VWREEAVSNCEGATFEKKKMRGLQAKSRLADPTIWVGKDGASHELLKQVENQLKTRELVKVKAHKTALAEVETADLAECIATSTHSTLVEVMGHTFTLYKKREAHVVETKR